MLPEDYLLEYEGRIKVSETSYLGLRPGDLVNFSYSDGTDRFGLVVRSKRTSPSLGYFLSSRNNTLLNIYQLDSITADMFNMAINTLYRNRVACTYKHTPRILGAFLGQTSFRTFNVSKISNIKMIIITK